MTTDYPTNTDFETRGTNFLNIVWEAAINPNSKKALTDCWNAELAKQMYQILDNTRLQ